MCSIAAFIRVQNFFTDHSVVGLTNVQLQVESRVLISLLRIDSDCLHKSVSVRQSIVTIDQSHLYKVSSESCMLNGSE